MTIMTEPTEIRLDLGEELPLMAIAIHKEIQEGVMAPALYRMLKEPKLMPGRSLTAKQIHDLLAIIGIRYVQAVVEARETHFRKESNAGTEPQKG